MLQTGAGGGLGARRHGSDAWPTEQQSDVPGAGPLIHDLIDLAAAAKVSRERVRHLLDAVVSVGSDLSMHNVTRRVVAAARELTGARYGVLRVIDQDGEVIESGSVDDHPASGSFLAMPVRSRGTVFGQLQLSGKIGALPFTQEDEDVVGALAAAAGLAIENAKLYEGSHRREAWLRATNEVTALLRTGVEDLFALRLLARRARETAGAALAAVAVPDSPTDLRIQAGNGDLRAQFEGLRIPVVESLAGDVFSTGRARRIDQLANAVFARSAQTFDRLPLGVAQLGPTAFAPLRTGPHPRGVLIVAKPVGARPFDEDDLRMIDGYASQAALAMESAQAQLDRQRLALFEERDRIARDLHDLVIQRLFAIGIGIQGLTRGQLDTGLGERLGSHVADIDQTIREIRRSIFSLQEPANGAYSPRADILRAISDAAATLGYEPTVRMEGPLDSVVPPEIHLDLVATLREALSNVVRHARASRVQATVTVDRAATRLELLVQDDGAGLPAEIAQRSGLANMLQRARRWCGDCVFETPPRGGTRVSWSVPLPRHPSVTAEEAP
ncbi:GAF:ATP-binding region, ATPase-like [Alloactinosynnema sp. L-07]|uniref:GAF domain-containing sensor histidine kinase n=1 Tax=Alloactinosynnema sp. L-07 TaxID=1653480 RepID=UPI00065F006A|nr:GAF domain-containing protein [Alloactinosynnema sp. L-07]CRK57411.1 GAF:ATP-binding region, ATPase-like [Alloactinosynnema sp. L-07]